MSWGRIHEAMISLPSKDQNYKIKDKRFVSVVVKSCPDSVDVIKQW